MPVLTELPSELVFQIFSRIKYEDRFETFKVSYEWFFLTLKTYKDTMTPKNDLLVSMADFFNQVMGVKKYSSWMQLFRYMNPTKAEISSSDSPAFIKAVYKCNASLKFMEVDMGHFLTEFWKSYPNLKCITVDDGLVPVDKVKIIKDAYGSFYIPKLIYGESARHCFDFELKRLGSTFALSTVTLEFGALPITILAAALKAIKESKTVHTFVIMNPVITTKWNKVFPLSVRRLFVVNPVIKESAAAQIKDLLFFLSKDWKSLTHFQIRLDNAVKYQFIRKTKEEMIHIWWPEIPSQFTNGFERSCIKIDRLRDVEHLKKSLPASVRTLQLEFSKFPKEFSPKQLFSNPPKLETLSLEMPMVKNISFGDFSGLSSLHTLLLDCIGPKALETIFLSLPSLKNLGTKFAEEGTFTRLPEIMVSSSLTKLTITNSCVNNSFIVTNAPNLKQLFVYQYDPKKHQLGFLCSSLYSLDVVVIIGKYDLLLCRAIGSDLADYPYKCIIADWRFPSISYTYVLSRKVESLRSLVLETHARCIQKMTLYAHGFSVAFLQKKPNLEIYFGVEEFLNIVDWRTGKDANKTDDVTFTFWFRVISILILGVATFYGVTYYQSR